MQTIIRNIEEAILNKKRDIEYRSERLEQQQNDLHKAEREVMNLESELATLKANNIMPTDQIKAFFNSTKH